MKHKNQFELSEALSTKVSIAFALFPVREDALDQEQIERWNSNSKNAMGKDLYDDQAAQN